MPAAVAAWSSDECDAVLATFNVMIRRGDAEAANRPAHRVVAAMMMASANLSAHACRDLRGEAGSGHPKLLAVTRDVVAHGLTVARADRMTGLAPGAPDLDTGLGVAVARCRIDRKIDR
ncbi:MAG: hypothetical protein AAFV86_10315 [Pseudomonadota bacterium]